MQPLIDYGPKVNQVPSVGCSELYPCSTDTGQCTHTSCATACSSSYGACPCTTNSDCSTSLYYGLLTPYCSSSRVCVASNGAPSSSPTPSRSPSAAPTPPYGCGCNPGQIACTNTRCLSSSALCATKGDFVASITGISTKAVTCNQAVSAGTLPDYLSSVFVNGGYCVTYTIKCTNAYSDPFWGYQGSGVTYCPSGVNVGTTVTYQAGASTATIQASADIQNYIIGEVLLCSTDFCNTATACSPPSSSGKASDLNAAIGGALGGLAVVLLLVVIIRCNSRKRNTAVKLSHATDMASHPVFMQSSNVNEWQSNEATPSPILYPRTLPYAQTQQPSVIIANPLSAPEPPQNLYAQPSPTCAANPSVNPSTLMQSEYLPQQPTQTYYAPEQVQRVQVPSPVSLPTLSLPQQFPPLPPGPAPLQAAAGSPGFCTSCGARMAAVSSKFCSGCGAPRA
jgi:hypothetical protein